VQDAVDDVEALVAAVCLHVAVLPRQEARRRDREVLGADDDSGERVAVAPPELVRGPPKVERRLNLGRRPSCESSA
jgi:hypothetical protein